MRNSEEFSNMELNGELRNSNLPNAAASTSDSSYRLFGRQTTIHQIMGGGKAADVILWRRRRVSCGIICVATVAWFLFERSGLSFISICSDVLLTLVVLLFLRANYADFRNKQLESLPELVLSEEMINNAAGSLRVKVNYMLLMAHDIALGKDFKLFFKVVIALWVLSVIGSQISFFTLAYVGVIIFNTVPALYNKFEDHIDRYAGMVHRKLSRHYKVVDDSLMSRLPHYPSKDL